MTIYRYDGTPSRDRIGNVIRHPAQVVRFVRIWEAEPGQWEARFHDRGEVTWRTGRGALWLVLDALVNEVPDKGLPRIFVPHRRARTGGRAA